MRKIFLMCFLTFSLLGGSKIYKGDLSNFQLEKMLNRGVAIIDIRTPPEWRHLGIIPGSKRLMFFDERGSYNLKKFIADLEALGVKKGDEVIIICRTGNRSVHVSNMLAQRGFKNVYNVKKGIKGWIRSGKKTSRIFR